MKKINLFSHRADDSGHTAADQRHHRRQMSNIKIHHHRYTILPQHLIHCLITLLGGCMDCLVNLTGTKYDKVVEFTERYREDGIVWFLEACDIFVLYLSHIYPIFDFIRYHRSSISTL